MSHPLHELTLEQLRRRTSVKWRVYPEDVLPLWVAEMDALPAPAVRDALTTAVELGDTGYGMGVRYIEALRLFAKERWGWDFGEARVVPDVMQGVVAMMRLISLAGDQVVVNPPVYTPFYAFLEASGRHVVESPLTEDGRLDLAHLEQTFRDVRPASYLLCSPHNPTGTVHTRAELEAVARLAREHGVRVVADEIHAPLVYGGHEHVPYTTVDPRALSLLSASKAWNLAGLKAAVAVAGSEAAEDLARLPEVVEHGASHFGEIAHVAALTRGVDWLDDLLADLDANRRLLADLLAEHLPAVRYRMPEGTYLAWLDCRGLGLGDEPAKVFLERGRVALNEGAAFGPGGEGHVRLNLATTPDLLREAVRRMAASLEVEEPAQSEVEERAQRASRDLEHRAQSEVEERAQRASRDLEHPQPAKPLTILFVCTANICRSAFAEVWARHLLGDDRSVEVASAGTHGHVDEPIDHTIGQTLLDRGADPRSFRSRRLTPAMVDEADLVITMEARHRAFVLADRPAAFRKTFTLGQLDRVLAGLPEEQDDLLKAAARSASTPSSEDDVKDPYRLGPEVAEAAAVRLTDLLGRVLVRLAQGTSR